jgi:hypothetical protein
MVGNMLDIVYLSTVLISGILLCATSAAGRELRQFGWMAMILVAGDAFHLLPRIYALWNGGIKAHTAMLGSKADHFRHDDGVLCHLWDIGVRHYPSLADSRMTVIIYALAVLRIALCLFPQNRWTSEAPPRNGPFGGNSFFYSWNVGYDAFRDLGARQKRRARLSWVAVRSVSPVIFPLF